jgi:hypothetical protein
MGAQAMGKQDEMVALIKLQRSAVESAFQMMAA